MRLFLLLFLLLSTKMLSSMTEIGLVKKTGLLGDQQVLVLREHGQLKIWNYKTPHKAFVFPKDDYRDFFISKNQKQIIVLTDSGELTLWDVEQKKPLVKDVSVDNRMKHIVALYGTKSVVLTDGAFNIVVLDLQKKRQYETVFTSYQLSGAGRYLIGLNGKQIEVVDMKENMSSKRFQIDKNESEVTGFHTATSSNTIYVLLLSSKDQHRKVSKLLGLSRETGNVLYESDWLEGKATNLTALNDEKLLLEILRTYRIEKTAKRKEYWTLDTSTNKLMAWQSPVNNPTKIMSLFHPGKVMIYSSQSAAVYDFDHKRTMYRLDLPGIDYRKTVANATHVLITDRRSAYLIDEKSGLVIKTFTLPPRLQSMLFSTDGSKIITASYQIDILGIDQETKKSFAQARKVLDIAFLDDKRLRTIDQIGDAPPVYVNVWDLSTGRLQHSRPIEDKWKMPLQNCLLYADQHGFEIWNVDASKRFYSLKHPIPRRKPVISDDCRFVLYDDEDSTKVWGIEQKDLIKEFKGKHVFSTFNSDGSFIVTGDLDGLPTDKSYSGQYNTYSIELNTSKKTMFSKHRMTCGTQAIRNSREVTTCFRTKQNVHTIVFDVWDPQTNKTRLSIQSDSANDFVKNWHISPDGTKLIVYREKKADGSRVSIWDLKNGKKILDRNSTERGLRIAVSPDNKLVAAGAHDVEIEALLTQKKRQTLHFLPH